MGWLRFVGVHLPFERLSNPRAYTFTTTHAHTHTQPYKRPHRNTSTHKLVNAYIYYSIYHSERDPIAISNRNLMSLFAMPRLETRPNRPRERNQLLRFETEEMTLSVQ